ncbi:PREDICTED: testis-expressed sequence 2 protein-like, partial [Phaethon lepturus]|uniref:testis-expressed sequence 2 protein-like n=1 Tax=Phaethon lepturus TaxID=97097 RepID=UPI0005308E07
CYDLTDAKVFLCPPSLARKRTWNKKYPICILLPDAADVERRSSEEQDAELQRDEGMKKAPATGQDVPGDCRERCLYLFGRTGREKEEWYQHLVRASRGTPSSSHGEARAGEKQPSWPLLCAGTEPGCRGGGGSAEDIPSTVPPKDLAGSVREKIFLDYSTYMARFVPAQVGGSLDWSPSHGALGSPTPTKLDEDTAGHSEVCMAWMNALVGRIFWDFLREPYWAEQVSSKIQKKLSKIKLPYFMNELMLTELDMGTSIPSVLSASNPTINDQGLWVDMEVTYSGSLQMTLETKMNLCKLGKESTAEESDPAEAGREGPRLILLADSDAESSSAGSSDEDDITAAEPTGALGERVPPPGAEGHVSGNSTSRKILRLVDKIAKSKYFQKATENEFIKKKIEEVSNTPLLLTVEVQELAGTLAVNIPPPPTDRVWYSFRVPPQLELKVHPKLGEREVTFLHVTEWIEKKLQHEFQKILVMPNMDDLIIPIMRSGLDPQPPRDLPAKGEKRL